MKLGGGDLFCSTQHFVWCITMPCIIVFLSLHSSHLDDTPTQNCSSGQGTCPAMHHNAVKRLFMCKQPMQNEQTTLPKCVLMHNGTHRFFLWSILQVMHRMYTKILFNIQQPHDGGPTQKYYTYSSFTYWNNDVSGQSQLHTVK